MKPFFAVLLSLISGLAAAQQSGAAGPSQPVQSYRWGLGIGTAVSSGIYAGEDTRLVPFPLVSYEGERLFWRGIGGGIHLFRRPSFSIDATLSARMDGIEKDDFGARELAVRGIDRALLDDRDDGLDLGLALNWRGAPGQLELGVKGDVSNASKGVETSLKYAYPFQWGGARISPHVGVSHLSSKLANYYYGILPQETARGVASYRPGSATVPRIGIDVVRPFAGRWAFVGTVAYQKLPGKLSDSPLVDEDADGKVSAFIGVSRGF